MTERWAMRKSCNVCFLGAGPGWRTNVIVSDALTSVTEAF